MADQADQKRDPVVKVIEQVHRNSAHREHPAAFFGQEDVELPVQNHERQENSAKYRYQPALRQVGHGKKYGEPYIERDKRNDQAAAVPVAMRITMADEQ